MAHVSAFARTASPSIVGAALAALSNVYRDFVAARAVEQTYAQLAALSDRELADIGLNRGSIYEAASGRARHV